MTTKLISIAICAVILGSAFALLIREQLHKLRCQRCVKPYAIFWRAEMRVCRECRNALDALTAARAAWYKAKRLNA
jgi:type II secretory pathway component PulJ